MLLLSPGLSGNTFCCHSHHPHSEGLRGSLSMLPALSALCGLPGLLRSRKGSQAGFCRAHFLAALRAPHTLGCPWFWAASSCRGHGSKGLRADLCPQGQGRVDTGSLDLEDLPVCQSCLCPVPRTWLVKREGKAQSGSPLSISL